MIGIYREELAKEYEEIGPVRDVGRNGNGKSELVLLREKSSAHWIRAGAARATVGSIVRLTDLCTVCTARFQKFHSMGSTQQKRD